MTDTGRSVEVATNTVARAHFINIQRPALVIEKVDTDGNPLANAEFEVRTLSGALLHRGTTTSGGVITIAQINPQAVSITEVRAPQGFVITEPSRIVEIVAGETRVERFVNHRAPALIIEKVCVDGNPLGNAEFEVRRLNGELVHRVVTNSGGLAVIDVLYPGAFQILETRAPEGFVITEPSRAIEIVAGQTLTERFVNHRAPSLILEKVDTEGNPLANAEFEIRTLGGELLHRVVTNQGGVATIEHMEPMAVEIIETRPPEGHVIVEPSRTVQIRAGQTLVERFVNPRYATVVLHKICGNTSESLPGVLFEITTLAGERIRNPQNNSFEFISDSSGMIRLPQLPSGTFVATELRALPGFRLAEPFIFQIGHDREYIFTLRNYRYSQVSIHKIDGDNPSVSLPNVAFEIHRLNGERIQNPATNAFEFVTDSAGRINLGFLPDGAFIAVEVRSLPGFRLAEPVHFEVVQGRDLTVVVRNYRQAELTVLKVNSITREPLENVHFEISRPDGTRLVNPQNGNHTFITDSRGIIHLPAVDDEVLYLHETRALPGFLVDQEITRVVINSEARQREHLAVVENTPASGLLIVKTCASTNMPLQNVEFEVRHADGRLVRGFINDQNQPGTPANSPNIAPNGNFLTDHRGHIHLNHLESGVFHISETRALPGFLLDSTVHVVTITPGRLSTLEVTNEQMAGLRLYKIDSVTRLGIQGVEFRIYDFITNQEVAGPFITDNNGVIDFTGILPSGRFTIRESREAPGYLRDTMPRTIEFRAGMVTEVVWENTREAGQIQITKLSSADNEVNGLPRGSRLEGAVFEVRDWRTGNVMDQFITDSRGVGVSRPLPLGRFLIEEIVAPPFYKRSDVVLDVTIEHSGQILRYEFFNEPANVGVEVRKTGPFEVMSGQPIVWNITTIANSSTIELSDFYVRDILPAHAVRLDRIFTGTFNQSLRYSVMFRTNTNDTWRVAYDNLSSTSNNALAMSPAALGLGSNEHVTEIMYSFGTVRAGFRSVEAPRIEGTVRDGLQNGYEFVNRVDLGGRTGSEWVVGNGSWVTRVFRPSPGPHPRTGW